MHVLFRSAGFPRRSLVYTLSYLALHQEKGLKISCKLGQEDNLTYTPKTEATLLDGEASRREGESRF